MWLNKWHAKYLDNFLAVSSLIRIYREEKNADKIASVNQALLTTWKFGDILCRQWARIQQLLFKFWNLIISINKNIYKQAAVSDCIQYLRQEMSNIHKSYMHALITDSVLFNPEKQDERL